MNIYIFTHAYFPLWCPVRSYEPTHQLSPPPSSHLPTPNATFHVWETMPYCLLFTFIPILYVRSGLKTVSCFPSVLQPCDVSESLLYPPPPPPNPTKPPPLKILYFLSLVKDLSTTSSFWTLSSIFMFYFGSLTPPLPPPTSFKRSNTTQASLTASSVF